MNARRDSTDGPENVDELFAEIVAGLERDGVGKDWLDLDEAGAEDTQARDTHAQGTRPRDTLARDTKTRDVPDEDSHTEPEDDRERPEPDDHYVPPEPPPFPVLRASTIVALAILALGVVLLVAPGLFGLHSSLGTPLSLVALCAGVGLLILRMRNTPPPDSGWDDGAQV